MSTTEERLASIEAKLDRLRDDFSALCAGIRQTDHEVVEAKIERAKMQFQLKLLAGVLSLLVLGGGGLASLLRLV